MIAPLDSALTKNTGGGGTPTLPRRAALPPSYAPRDASIPCGLSRLRILPVTTGCTPTCFRLLCVLWQIPLARPLFSYSLAPTCDEYKSLFPPARDGWPVRRGGQPLYFHKCIGKAPPVTDRAARRDIR